MISTTHAARAVTGALLALATGALSIDAQLIPAPRQAQPVALTGGTIHTVTQGVIENGTIVFENGRITAVGANVAVPANAQRVDVTGQHIYPGLVDAYSQMGMFEIGGFTQTIDLNEIGDFNPNVRAHVAFNPESRHIGPARSNGVLVTVSSPGGGLVSGMSAAMMLDGWTWEQMTLQPETGLMINWPSAAREEQYDQSVRELREFFDDARAYRTARQAAPERHGTDSRMEAMIPVLEGTVPVVINANQLRQIQDAVDWATEQNLRMVLLGGRDAGFVSSLLAERDIPVLLTSVLDSPDQSWQPYDEAYSLPARLHAAGVRFGITGGSSAAYAYRLPYEAGAAVAFGLPADVALRAVTQSPADFLGFGDRVGSLEVGKDATLLITTGNPLEYSTIVEQAYIEGRMIDMTDQQRAFFEKYSEKLRQMRVVF